MEDFFIDRRKMGQGSYYQERKERVVSGQVIFFSVGTRKGLPASEGPRGWLPHPA